MKKPPLPDHIRRHLETTQGVDHATVARKARPHPCRRCRAWCWRALDADTCALDVLADPTPLTPLGETIALLTGKATYRISEHGGRKEIDRRHEWDITAKPAGTIPRADVITDHQCGYDWNGKHTTHSRLPSTTPATHHSEPPF